MRFEGTLKRWNDDKGFGFIAPVQGGVDVFVHVSAFARDGTRPIPGMRLSYELETAADGRQRAASVQRRDARTEQIGQVSTAAASSGPRPPAGRLPPAPARRSFTTPVLVFITLLVALGSWGYHAYVQSRVRTPPHAPVLTGPLSAPAVEVPAAPPVKPPPAPVLEVPPVPAPLIRPQAPASRYACDGRTHCSQMTSCEEARYFLKHCPGVQMDGNHDGEPCEQQWCTSPWAR